MSSLATLTPFISAPWLDAHGRSLPVRPLPGLRPEICHGRLFSWLQDLTAQARAIWKHRRALARRPYCRAEADAEFAEWLATLPREAFVYDLSAPTAARGWRSHDALAGEGAVMCLKTRIGSAGRYASVALLAGVANPAAAADLAYLLSAVWEPATAYGCLLIAVFCMLQRK